MADEKELIQANPLLEALNKISSSAATNTGLDVYDEMVRREMAHRKALQQLKQITQPRYARRTGMSNAELFQDAANGIKNLFGGQPHELLEMPSDPRNIYYRAKEVVNRMYSGEFSMNNIPGYKRLANPSKYGEILDEAIQAITDIGDGAQIASNIAHNRVNGGLHQHIRSLLDEVGYKGATGLPIDFDSQDLANAQRVLMGYGNFEYGPTGKLLYDSDIRKILPHMSPFPFGEVSIEQQQTYMQKNMPRSYQFNPMPRDPYVDSLLGRERFDSLASRVERNLKGKFGSRVTPAERITRSMSRPGVVLGELSRGALKGSDITLNGRQFEILGTDSTGFRLRQKATVDSYIEFSGLDQMLKDAYSSRPVKASDTVLRKFMSDITNSAMDTVGVANMAAESFSDVSVRNADREIAALFSKAVTNYGKTSKATGELKAAKGLFNKALGMVELNSGQDILSRVGEHSINWLARDAMVKHMTWMIPDLVGMAAEDLDERASDLAYQLNTAFLQTTKDLKKYRGERTVIDPITGKSKKILEAGKNEVEQILVNNFRTASMTDIYGNTDVSKQIRAGVGKIKRMLGSESTRAEDVVRYIANARDNALLMDDNIATLHRLFKADPAGLESIVSNVWNIEKTRSLDSIVKMDEEGKATRLYDLVANKKASSVGLATSTESRLLRRERIVKKTRAKLSREAVEREIGPRPSAADGLTGKALKAARRDWNKRSKSIAASVQISDADIVNRISGGAVRAEMAGGRLRIYPGDPRMAQNLGAELMVGGERVAYSSVLNAWLNRSGRAISGGYGPEVTLGADLVLGQGRISGKANRILRALRGNEVLYQNLNMPTYNIARTGTSYANINRDLSLAKRISGGSKFWSVDFETSGLGASADILEASFQSFRLGNTSPLLNKTFRFDVSQALASNVETALHKYLPGFSRGNVVPSSAARAAHNAASMAGDTVSAQLIENTVLKYSDFFSMVGSKQGALNRARADKLIRRINADQNSIVAAHHAAGAEIPWSRSIGGTGINPARVMDTETIAKMANRGGYIGPEGRRGFSLNAIMNQYGMGAEKHLAAADATANAAALSRTLPGAISNAAGLKRIRPGSYFVRHTGRNLGGRGGMQYLGAEAVEGGYAAHFRRTDTGAVVSMTGESMGALQHSISSQMTATGKRQAIASDRLFLNDAIRREAEAVMSSPVRAHRLKNEMLLLQRVAQENGVPVGRLSSVHFEGLNNNIAQGLTQRRLSIVQGMESWYNNVYTPAYGQTIDNIVSAMDARYITTKDAYRIQREYYNEYRSQLGNAIPSSERATMPWERNLSFEYGNKTHSISLASFQDAERTINNVARELSGPMSGTTNAQVQRLDQSQSVREIGNMLRNKYNIPLDETDLNPTATSLADRLMQYGKPSDTIQYQNMMGIDINDPLEMTARLNAEKKANDALGKAFGANSDLAMQDLGRINEIRNTVPYEEQVDAIDQFLQKERKWTNSLADAATTGEVTARVGAEKTMLGSMFEGISDWFKNGPLKGKGKGVAIAAGLLGAGYIFSNFTNNDPLPMDEQPQHNRAPGADGVYDNAGAYGTGSRTVRVQADGSGYQGQGYRFNISASNGDPNLDSSAMGALINEAFASATPVDVRLNINNTDNTNKLDNSWYQKRFASALSG